MAAAASLPPEIWRLIGENIFHRQTLSSLVGVCRAFCNIFTPLLYARRIINLEYFSKPLNETPLPPYLEYVQDLRINLYEFKPSGATYSIERNDEFAEWITRALKSMKRIHSFTWCDESFEESYGPALILQNPDLLRALKSIRTLRNISISYDPKYVHDPVPARKCWFPLRVFRDLISLEIYNFYGDCDRLVKDITHVLCDSPRLKKLGLGFASEIDSDDEAILFGGPGREANFLERLCEFYGSICKKGPLELETLRLGFRIFLDEPLKAANDHYLTKLLIVKSLKVLHMYNGLVKSDLEENDSFYPVIDWTPFTSEECSLRQLSVTRLEKDVIGWLKYDGSCVQELIVMDHYCIDDEGLNEFFNIPSQLSMLWTREKHPSVKCHRSSRIDSDDWSDTDSSISDTLDSESSDSKSSHSDPSPSAPLNPATLKLDKTVMTILDRLPDGGSHLTRLALALDFETQWLHFSSHLPHLTRLIHLRLNAKSWYGGNYPTQKSSLWHSATSTAEIAFRYAQLICSLCPTLRYIKIGHDLAWEVVRLQFTPSAGARTRSKSKSEKRIRLRELDGDEVLEIALFAFTDFDEHSGLLGRARDRVEKVVGKQASIEETNAIQE